MRWMTCVPLIGGLTVAAKQVTGTDPVAFASYTPFALNEENAKLNFPNTPHFFLDQENLGGFNVEAYKNLDFINTVCPCAGLSLLSSGGPEQRAKMNAWMLKTAEFATGELKPKVFWGENAPALYSKSGDLVRQQLRDIAAKNGYSFSIYGTNTELHGIPQNRKRTFYFFWRDQAAPIFEYFRTPRKDLQNYLDEVPVGVDLHEQSHIDEATEFLNSYPYVMFLQDKYQGKGIEAIRTHVREKEKRGTSVLSYLIKSEQLEEAKDWCLANNFEKYAKEAARIMDKVSIRKGFWDGSLPMYRADNTFATLISRTFMAIHPTKDRIITTREAMHLMGLPHDFKLANSHLNAICQNVPTCTGTDMTRMVVKYINNELKSSGARFLMQSNLNERIDAQESLLLEF